MQITPIKYALHEKDESPIFGTDTIHIIINELIEEVKEENNSHYINIKEIAELLFKD